MIIAIAPVAEAIVLELASKIRLTAYYCRVPGHWRCAAVLTPMQSGIKTRVFNPTPGYVRFEIASATLLSLGPIGH